jgi:hypothetical protein
MKILINYKYNNKKFIIIKKNYSTNGLFGFYVSFLGCINIYNNKGYFPIIDLSSFPNIFNKFNVNSVNENPWELFFDQPYGFQLKNIKKYAKHIQYANCYPNNRPNTENVFINNSILKFWRYIAQKYIPIKKKIINEANKKRKEMFNDSNNILGVLLRGTDYIARRPKYHPIQPNPDIVIKDIKYFDKKYKYDWIFITTEDELIREKFIHEFKNKLKYLIAKKNIKYDYKKKSFLGFNANIRGNINYVKIYLINIIILSKCLDIICSRTAGSIGAFLFSKGFRNSKIYYLGRYK